MESAIGSEIRQLIGGVWRAGEGSADTTLIDPSNEQPIAVLRHAGTADLNDALAAAARGFAAWRAIPPFDRARVLRAAAELLRQRVEEIARSITLQQGKPLREASTEVRASADILDWFAEEGRRGYGRIVPGRQPGQLLQIRLEPVGPVAAFAPWNFPISQAARKVAAALSAGCSMVLKPSEEAPFGAVALAQSLMDAGLPEGVLNLVMGDPAEISRRLIRSGVIRKISFTGSVAVGKLLAAQAAVEMKPCTMELGGHAPVFVCEDTDAAAVARQLVAMKFRNAGQACISPTRFFIHRECYAEFRAAFTTAAQELKVGNGLDPGTDIGPLANRRRLQYMIDMAADATARGAKILIGGARIGDRGFYFAPTVLEAVDAGARIMTEEPFGPIAVLIHYDELDEALALANALPYGLAAYVFSDSGARAERIAAALEVGMVGVNNAPIALPETPFGGIKDSGYGREGGCEGFLPYTVTKLVASC